MNMKEKVFSIGIVVILLLALFSIFLTTPVLADLQGNAENIAKTKVQDVFTEITLFGGIYEFDQKIKEISIGIKDNVFNNYTFFEVYELNAIPPDRYIIAVSLEEKAYALHTDFNEFLADENILIRDGNTALKIVKCYIMMSQTDKFSEFKFLENANDIPSSDDDFKNPQSYLEVIQPPQIISIGDSNFLVALNTWSKTNGVLIKWEIEIVDDQITAMKWNIIDVGVGDFIGKSEGFLPLPGTTRTVTIPQAYATDIFGPKMMSSQATSTPKVEVDDYYCDIRTDATGTTTRETTHITISGFDADTDVNVNVVLYEFPLTAPYTIAETLQSFVVHTDASGHGSEDFTPEEDDNTGVGNVIATQANDTTKKDELDDFYHVERIIEDTSGDGVNTYKVYYFSANFDWDKNAADTFAEDVLEGAINAYDIEVSMWHFNHPDPDHICYIWINDGEHPGSTFYETGPGYDPSKPDEHLSTHCHSGDDTEICIQSNIEDILRSLDPNIQYPSQEAMLRSIVAHEHFHNIQWGYNEWKRGILWTHFNDWLWVTEGQARFIETAIDPDTNHRPTTLFYTWRLGGANGFMRNPDRPLEDMSYDYCPYWGYIYQHDGGMSTIRQILAETNNVGYDSATDGAEAITTILTTVPGDHNTFAESIEDFAVAAYKKEPNDFNWGGPDSVATNRKNWGTYLNDVTLTADRTYPDTINKLNPVIDNTLNEWAADYVEVEISPDVKSGDAEVGFEGEGCLLGLTHSDYTVKLILFNATYPNGLVLDFVDDHENDVSIPNINEYDKVVAVIGCRGHCFGGNGGYTFVFASPLYLDVVLDFDRSGSMGWEAGKLEGAKIAGKAFIDLLEKPTGWWIFKTDRDKVGLVSFASSATLDGHLTSDFDDAKNVINGYSAGGGTNMGDALIKSIDEIETNGREGTIRSILYLTDGMTNTGPTPDEILNILVPQANDAGIFIYTLGYGSDVDSAFLSQVANKGNGKYYFAPDRANLTKIYIELSHTAKGWQPTASFSGTVGQGETQIAGTLNVQPGTSLIKVLLTWPGSDLDLILVDPNGNQTLPGAGVIYSGNDTLPEYYEVYDPQPGDWTIEVYGKVITSPEEEYYVMVFQPGALMQVRPTKWDVNYPMNRTTIFNVSEIAGNVNLTNVTFDASDLTETVAASTVKSLMKSQAEAEERGEMTTAALTNVYTQSTNIIPANCFSFTPNNFSVPASSSVDVQATLTLPSASIPSGTYSGNIYVNSSGGNATISVTVIVTSVNTSTGTGTAYFASDAGSIEDLIGLNESDLPEENPNVDFPQGLFSFNITGLNLNQTVNITIAFPSDIPTTAQYWKYHAPEGWYQIPLGSNDGDNVITIQLTDGGIGDDDGVANGIIVDQGGPGIPTAVARVPALTLIGLVALVGLLSVIAISKIRRREK